MRNQLFLTSLLLAIAILSIPTVLANNCVAGSTWSSSGTAPCAPCTTCSGTPTSACTSTANTVCASAPAFYLSGSQSEGVSAFSSINAPVGITHTTDVFGTSNGAINLARGSYLSSPGSSSPSTLPSGGNVAWSASAWINCNSPSSNHSAVLEWGASGDVGGGLSSGAAAIVVNGAGESATSFDLSVFASGLNQPSGISIDSSNNIYVVDKNNGLVRKITPDNVMTTIISGLYSPRGVCVDSNGNVIVSDSGNNAVRKISSDGTIVSIGSGFYSPTCVAVDLLSNNIYVCESSTIKRVTPLGVISTIASGISPMGICVDANGNIFIADSFREYPWAASRSVIKKFHPVALP